MNMDVYRVFVGHGTMADSERDKKLLVGLGCGGEGGEVCDEVKKVVLHRKPFDRDKMKKELGDLLWYLQLGCNVFQIPLQEVILGNMEKLCERYPTHYGDSESWLQAFNGTLPDRERKDPS